MNYYNVLIITHIKVDAEQPFARQGVNIYYSWASQPVNIKIREWQDGLLLHTRSIVSIRKGELHL